MQLFKHSPLDRHYYEEIEAQHGGHKMEHQVCGYLTSYELSNDYLLLDIAVNFPDKTEESTLLAYYFTAPGVNTELCDLFIVPDEWYLASIENIEVNEDKRRIYVRVILDDYPDDVFVKSIPLSSNIRSQAANLFESLQLLNKRGEVKLEEAEGLRVIVTLKEASDYAVYINGIELYNEEEEE